MKLWCLKGSRGRVYPIVPGLMMIFAAFLCLQQQCQAGQQLGSQSALSMDPNGQTAGSFDGGFGTVVGWIYCGLAAFVITVGVIVFLRRNKRHSRRRRRAGAPITHSRPSRVSIRNNSLKLFQHSHRKRAFDYPKFYTKVMGELYRQSYELPGTTNVKSNSYGSANGHSNDDSKSHSNGDPSGQSASTDSNINHTVKSNIEDLIAWQKILIQEQKKILEQQTRLIEEKRGLIDDQTSVPKAHVRR